jgi:hypothetical protein
MIETTYALHTMAPHLTPYASHALTTAHGLVSHIVAMPNDPNPPAGGGNIFDQLFGIGDDLKTALIKRGVGVVASLAIIGVVLMIAGQSVGRAILGRVVMGVILIFFILGPMVTYLTGKFGAVG